MYLHCGRALMPSCIYSVARRLCCRTTYSNKQCTPLPPPLSLSLPLSLPSSSLSPQALSLSLHPSPFCNRSGLISGCRLLQPPYHYNEGLIRTACLCLPPLSFPPPSLLLCPPSRFSGGMGLGWAGLGQMGGMGWAGGDVPWWTVAGCEPNDLCRFGVKNARGL
jgi:hypothetical protein